MNIRQRNHIICFLTIGLLLSCCQSDKLPAPTLTPTPLTALAIPGVVLFYSFNGNASDMSGNQNNGQVNGATLITDRFGISNCAYYFDGVDDYIAFDPLKMPLGNSPRTISAWVKAESYPPELFPGLGSRPTVIGWGLQDWDQLSEIQIVNGSLQFHTYGSNDRSSSAVLELNHWYHLAVVFTEGKLSLYINGVEEDFDVSTIDTQLGTGRIGTWPEPPQPTAGDWKNMGYFHGIIDDISVYNQALTTSQIEALYTEGGWEE